MTQSIPGNQIDENPGTRRQVPELPALRTVAGTARRSRDRENAILFLAAAFGLAFLGLLCIHHYSHGESNQEQSSKVSIEPFPLNGASLQQLRSIPKVGKRTAEQILEAKGKLGRFESWDQVQQVKGVGKRTIAHLKRHCFLDHPKPVTTAKVPAQGHR